MLKALHDWLIHPRKADREASARAERVIKAFTRGDMEVVKAEMVRMYGAQFFALLQQQIELERKLLGDRHDG